MSIWPRLILQLVLVWAAVFGVYEIVERTYLQDAGPRTLRVLHILRGSGTAFLLAFLGARAVYRRREALIVEAKERLEAEKMRQDQILSELGAGLVVLDAGFRVVFANSQAQKWLGPKGPSRLCLSEDCAMGKSAGVCPSRESVIRRGRVSYEEKVETPEGARHLYITAAPMPETDGRGSAGVIELIQDITPLKEMEARLRQSIAAARVGAVASGVAHQIGNPLSTVSAAVERLYSLGAAKQETYARYLRQIEAETDRAVSIIRSLMNLARRVGGMADRADGEADPVDICQSAREAVAAVSEIRAEARNRIHLYLPEHALPVRIHPVDVREVLINLLNNALDATANLPQARISIHAAEEHGRVVIMVCDNGSGVDPSRLENIFEPFFSTRRDGLGLGLFLCREFVESAGGEIRADNLPTARMEGVSRAPGMAQERPTGGARFIARFPAVHA